MTDVERGGGEAAGRAGVGLKVGLKTLNNRGEANASWFWVAKRIPKHTKTEASENNNKYNDHPKSIMGIASLNVVSKTIW